MVSNAVFEPLFGVSMAYVMSNNCIPIYSIPHDFIVLNAS